MLSKKKELKKATIAREALKHRGHSRNRSASSASASSSPTTEEKYTLASSPHASEDLFQQLGENINTRWNEISEYELKEMQEEEGVEGLEEKRRSLMEEARIAAGTRQRCVAAPVRAFLQAQEKGKQKGHVAPSSSASSSLLPPAGIQGVPLVRIHHNSNSITAVGALGTEVVVLGDKSGKVYVVTLSAPPTSLPSSSSVATASPDGAGGVRGKGEGGGQLPHSTTASSPHPYAPHQRKCLLFPMMATAVMSIAVSDTRDRFAASTTRSLLERTTVDTSCTSYIAAGCADGSISIWELQSRKHKGLLWLHRQPVMSVHFRPNSSTLLSVSKDRCLRVWSVPEMMTVDQLFGHEGEILCCDGLRHNTCVTVGDDGTMRFWKLDAATQQAYSYVQPSSTSSGNESVSSPTLRPPVKISLEVVAMLNESTVLAGSRDGALVLFDINRRRPVAVQPAIHGYNFVGDGTGLEKVSVIMDQLVEDSREEPSYPTHPRGGDTTHPDNRRNIDNGSPSPPHSSPLLPLPPLPNPITAIAAIPYGDVIATGSYDGYVRLWEVQGVGSGPETAGRRRADEAARKEKGRSGGSGKGADGTAGTTPGFSLLATIPIPGMINSLKFNWTGEVLYVAAAKEPRGGRWVVQQGALNSVYVIPLSTAVGLSALADGSGEVLHVPAELYGLKELEALENQSDEEDNDEEEHSAESRGRKKTSKQEEDPASYPSGEEEEEYYSFQTDEKDGMSEEEEEGQKESLLEVNEDGAVVLRKNVLSKSSEGKQKTKKKEKKKLRVVVDTVEEALPAILKKASKKEKEHKKDTTTKMKKKSLKASSEQKNEEEGTDSWGGENTTVKSRKEEKKPKGNRKDSKKHPKAIKESSKKVKKTLKL